MNLIVGVKTARSLTLTPSHVRTYAELTGDHNPLHLEVHGARLHWRYHNG